MCGSKATTMPSSSTRALDGTMYGSCWCHHAPTLWPASATLPSKPAA